MNLVNRAFGLSAPAPLENDQKNDEDPIVFSRRQKIINGNQDEQNA